MDPSYSINMNGFIYTPLSVEGYITSSGSPINSWPSFDGTLGYLASQADYPNYTRQQHFQQHGYNSQHNIGLTVDHLDQSEQGPLPSFASASLLSHISPSASSAPPSATSSSRHPLDLSPINSKNLSISSMDLLQPSPVLLHSTSADAFGLNTNNLSPFHHIQSSATLSRSSSSTSSGCIDPSALMLNHDPPQLGAHGSSTLSSSSCFSTPENRRLSSFSMGLEEDMTFSDAIAAYETARKNCTSSSNQSGPSTPDPSDSWHGYFVYTPGLLLADGTLLRFDGRSLVPAQLSTGPPIDFTVTNDSFVPSGGEGDCQEVITMDSSSMMQSSADLSLMMPSYIPYNEFSQLGIGVIGQGPPSSLTDPTLCSDPSLCLSQISMSSLTLESPSRSAIQSSTTLSSTNNPQSLKHKKMTSLRKSAFEDRRRRGSTDSAYHSSSSSSSSSSSTVKFRGSSSSISGRFDSNGNGNSSNSSNRYRKDGVGEFRCPFEGCDYHYNLRRELNRHRNVHVFAGRDKYRCMNCNSGLCRLDSVKRHMEAKGKSECLKRGLYQEFREDGELARVRHCKPSWYEGAAAVAATAAAASAAALEARRRRK